MLRAPLANLCSLPDPSHIRRTWGNVLIARPSGNFSIPPHLPSLTWQNPPRLHIHALRLFNSTRPWGALLANRRPIITPPQRLPRLKQTSRLFLPPVYPTTTRDRIKPNEPSQNFVQIVMKDIPEDQVIQDLLVAVRK